MIIMKAHIDFFYSQDKEESPSADFINTLTKGGRDRKGKNYISFLNLLKNTVYGQIGKGEHLTNKSVGSGWTDKTLTRIENIQDTLRNIGSGQIALGWTDKTLTRIEEIENTLRTVGSGYLKGSGWTDKTLTRIDDILDVLRNV